MIIKRDIRRIFLSMDILIGFLLVLICTLFLSILISSGTKFGISILGNLTIFSNGKLVLINGANYTKGIGFIVAVLISLFIGKEYQYKTLGYILSKGISRRNVYFTKVVSSIFIGISIFLMYEVLSYGILSLAEKTGISFREFIILLAEGILMYSVLSSIICFISMSFKNYILSLLLSIIFIFLESNIVVGIGKIMSIINLDSIYSKIAKYSLYGMNEFISNGEVRFNIAIVIGSIILLLISSLMGIINFNRQEL